LKIHDTSGPKLRGAWPANMDEDRKINKLVRWHRNALKDAAAQG
jgi:hypothetical protein